MKEDLAFENLALQEALHNNHAKNQRQINELQNRVEEISEHRDRHKKQSKLVAILSSVITLATGISHYRTIEKARTIIEARDKIIDRQSNTIRSIDSELGATQKSQNLIPLDVEKRIVEFSQRLELAQSSKGEITTSHDSAPSEIHRNLYNGSQEQKISALETIVGKHYIRQIQEMSEIKPDETELARDVTVASSHPDISANELRGYMQGFPSSWVKGKISKITIHQEDLGPKVSIIRSGNAIGLFETKSDKIDIFGAAVGKKNLTRFDKTLAHEMAHGNDWIRNSSLSFNERIDLLAKIASRTLSDDRYISTYVEVIGVKDQETTQSARCEEYFAELAAAYFNNPTELHYKDFLIIHNLVLKHNPRFDIDEYKRYRAWAFDTYKEL